MIEAALQEVGAARSIVIDEENNVLCGNGTIEAAGNVDITKLRIIDADGEEIVAVRRRGLTEEQKVKLALYDNRTAELAEWEPEVILERAEEGIDLSSLFSLDELEEFRESREEKDSKEGGPEVLFDQSLQLRPQSEFLLITCGTDVDLLERLRSILGLGMVRRGGYKPGSPFDAVRPARVVSGQRLLEVLSGDSSDTE
jgi:hypothetical protein